MILLQKEPPFKKNPTVRQLTVDFVRDLEARGLVSRCTAEEAHFVCNSLMLPKPNNKYRFVYTFQHLNANMVKDPYGMRDTHRTPYGTHKESNTIQMDRYMSTSI